MKEKLHAVLQNRLAKNFIKIFTGQNIGAVFQIFSMWVIIRAIGNSGNGMLIMVQTYSYLVSDFFNLQTFNAVIKYITASISNQDHNKTLQYIKMGFLLDFLFGLTSLIVGFVFFKFIAELMNWTGNFYSYAMLYLPIVLVRNASTGTATGILRFFDRFGTIVSINLTVNILRFLSYLLFLTMHFGLIWFISIEIAFEWFTGLALTVSSLKLLRKYGYAGFLKVKGDIPTYWNFFKFNLYNGTVLTFDLLLGNVSNMFVSRFLGFNYISFIRLLQRIGGITQKLASPLMQLFYPEMCRYVNEGKKKKSWILFNKTEIILTIVSSVISLGLIVFYPIWMPLFFKDIQIYFMDTILYLIFSVISVNISLVGILMVSFSYVKQNCIFAVVFDVIYIVSMPFLLNKIGIHGYVLLTLAQAVAMWTARYFYIKLKNRFV